MRFQQKNATTFQFMMNAKLGQKLNKGFDPAMRTGTEPHEFQVLRLPLTLDWTRISLLKQF